MAVAKMPFNPDVLALFRLAYPSIAGGSSERLANGQRERGENDDGDGRSGRRLTGSSASDHAWASGGDALRRSRVRRGHGERDGGFGDDGSSGDASAAAKTSELGYDDKSATPEVEPTGRKATLVSGEWWALLIACVLASCR